MCEQHRNKDIDKYREYMRNYMRFRRATNNTGIRLKKTCIMWDSVLDKYFTFFKQFVKKNYIIPTVREINIWVGNSSWNKTSVKFYQELIKRGYIKKVANRYAPTRHMMKEFFWIDKL